MLRATERGSTPSPPLLPHTLEVGRLLRALSLAVPQCLKATAVHLLLLPKVSRDLGNVRPQLFNVCRTSPVPRWEREREKVARPAVVRRNQGTYDVKLEWSARGV